MTYNDDLIRLLKTEVEFLRTKVLDLEIKLETKTKTIMFRGEIIFSNRFLVSPLHIRFARVVRRFAAHGCSRVLRREFGFLHGRSRVLRRDFGFLRWRY